MRYEFTRRWIAGSALAMGLLTVAANSRAEEPSAEPKQKALISFNMDFLSRFKKDEPAAETPATSAAPSDVIPVNAVEPLPARAGKSNAIPATNALATMTVQPAEPLPPTSLVTGQNAAPVQPLAAAAAQGQYPSVLPPSVPPVQLASGQFPLPAAGQMPFQTSQSPVVIMMPAGWQPDGNYTFAPRTVLSPEVPAEHWPTAQRNPLGDDSRKGLFSWPQIAKKITNSTIGEPEIKPQAPAPDPSSSRALFAVAAPQTIPAQVPALTAEQQPATLPQPAAQAATPAAPQPVAQPTTQPAAEVQPASKALFAPQPKQPEPQPESQPEQSKTRALFSLLSKPMNKPEAEAPASNGSKALFALGRKKEEPAAAPAPAVVPQYAAETPLPPEQNVPTISPTTTVEAVDPEIQPPSPPSVSNPLPGKLQTAKSDDPKMKWRSKGAPLQVVERAAVATDDAAESTVETTVTPVSHQGSTMPAAHAETAAAAMQQPIEAPAQPVTGAHANHRHVQHPPESQTASTAPISSERSLLGKHFPTAAGQTPRNASDSRDPWRRQAERDAAAAAEKKIEQPEVDSKAILPNVAALFPAVEKPSQPTHAKPQVTTVSATEDATSTARPVRRAHESSARSTDSYYADPWEREIEAQLSRVEQRQIGATSNRRAAVAQQAVEREELHEQPRVPFEVDELEQEKAFIRRTAKAPKPAAAARPKSTRPAGSPSNGARMAEQRSKKGYRRLTGSDLKQGFTRPLEIFSDMTKLPAPVKSAADQFERGPEDAQEAYTSGDEFEQPELSDDRPEMPAPPKRSAARQPVYELRQSSAAAASVMEFEDRERPSSDERQSPARVGQRGGRRQVERTARPEESEVPPEEAAAGDSGVVTAEDTEFEDAEAQRPVRPAMHIRNKHGNQVKIFTGSAVAGDEVE